jgi:hypothetical protein
VTARPQLAGMLRNTGRRLLAAQFARDPVASPPTERGHGAEVGAAHEALRRYGGATRNGRRLTFQGINVPIYHMKTVERVQTGVRLEKAMLKVLKGLAEYLDVSLGDLIEGIVLHAFEGKAPFCDVTRGQIDKLKSVYGLELTAADAHKLVEGADARAHP